MPALVKHIVSNAGTTKDYRLLALQDMAWRHNTAGLWTRPEMMVSVTAIEILVSEDGHLNS